MQLNINTDAAIVFTNKLEKMHRSALPVAIRSALNDAAFDVKTKTMPNSADKEFVNRSPNFFKANSRYEKAAGFNMNQMKATIGFVEGGLRGGNNYAVKDLQQQEHGGSIGGKAFIPLTTARVGKNKNKLVKPNARLALLRGKNVIDVNKVNAGSKKQKFMKAIFKAKELFGKNAFVLGNTWKGGKRTLSKIDSITKNGNGKVSIQRTPLYTVIKGRHIKIAGTNFMQRASLESGIKIERFFVMQAIKQFKKIGFK